jgi:hypothetical protein
VKEARETFGVIALERRGCHRTSRKRLLNFYTTECKKCCVFYCEGIKELCKNYSYLLSFPLFHEKDKIRLLDHPD